MTSPVFPLLTNPASPSRCCAAVVCVLGSSASTSPRTDIATTLHSCPCAPCTNLGAGATFLLTRGFGDYNPHSG